MGKTHPGARLLVPTFEGRFLLHIVSNGSTRNKYRARFVPLTPKGFKAMEDIRPGTPQNDPRCDFVMADVENVSGFVGWSDVSEAGTIVLIAEDDWLLRLGLADELGANGWTVVEAESGETALQILRSGLAVSLLITDIRLGGKISGWEVAEAGRRRDKTLPVIYVSASPSLDNRRVAGSVFLSKPCVISELLRVSRALCR
jgi:CheY-like chemotaxis protein